VEEKYVLKLFGENVQITSDEGKEYVNELYSTVTDAVEKIENIDRHSSMSKLMKSLFVSVFLADDLMKLRQENEELLKKLASAEKPKPKPKAKKSADNTEVADTKDLL